MPKTVKTLHTYVALDPSGQIVGFASGVERTGDPVYKGELNAIYILKSHLGSHQYFGEQIALLT